MFVRRTCEWHTRSQIPRARTCRPGLLDSSPHTLFSRIPVCPHRGVRGGKGRERDVVWWQTGGQGQGCQLR